MPLRSTALPGTLCVGDPVGMIARGEVCLIVLQKGISAGFVTSDYLAMGVFLVIISSFVAPIALKLIYRKIDKNANNLPDLDVSVEGQD